MKKKIELFVPANLTQNGEGPKRKKPKRQRATIILTDTDEGNFNLDLVFEPSIKNNPNPQSMSIKVAREAVFLIVSKYSPPKIFTPYD